jgi:hypothetical protein
VRQWLPTSESSGAFEVCCFASSSPNTEFYYQHHFLTFAGNLMLLSVDWDYFSGCAEHVFDAPIWGTRDTDFDRVEAWKHRAKKRGGSLSSDFPLLENWQGLKQLPGLPTYATLSHADAYGLLENLRFSEVINLDSHHDLYSQSGDATRVRAGNWAGLALAHGLVQHYTCIYPTWHTQLPVAEGFDLQRTWGEIGARFSPKLVQLERGSLESLDLARVAAVLLVQSPAWTNPDHDAAFFEVCHSLNATILEPPLLRRLF